MERQEPPQSEFGLGDAVFLAAAAVAICFLAAIVVVGY
jgi:hypothetical protein